MEDSFLYWNCHLCSGYLEESVFDRMGLDISHIVEHTECALVILGHIQWVTLFANKVVLEMPQKQTNMLANIR